MIYSVSLLLLLFLWAPIMRTVKTLWRVYRARRVRGQLQKYCPYSDYRNTHDDQFEVRIRGRSYSVLN